MPLLLPEHLALGGVGSYFWRLGTRVGGSAQLPLQRESFPTRPPRWGPTFPLESAQGEGDGPQPRPRAPANHFALAAGMGCPSLLWSVNRSFGDTGSTAFEAGSWPLTRFRKPSAKALSAGLLPGFSPRLLCSRLGPPELQAWLGHLLAA